VIAVARAKGTALFPARFTLVAAMNPCPCGNWGRADVACTCSGFALERYRRKLSGPIADRIDLWVEMGTVDLPELGKKTARGQETAVARKQVRAARAAQERRYKHLTKPSASLKLNSDLSPRELEDLVPLASEVRAILEKAGERLKLSPRAFHRVIKVARTIADLEEAAEIADMHILEALQYRERKQ
jgi:magnesium chelatase family protein